MRSIRKLCSLLLCCVMLLGLLPTTALAATVKQVDVTINAPKAGELLDFDPTGDTDEYNVGIGSSNVYWYDEESGYQLYSGDRAKAGHTYRVKIRVLAKSGSSFNLNTTSGYINRISAAVTGGSGAIWLETYFSVPSQITSVELELDAPVPGNTPDFRPSCGNTTYGLSTYFDDDDSYNYTENGVQWIDATTKKVMDADDTFVAGHTYQVFIHLTRYGNTEFYYDFGNTPPVTAEIRTENGAYTARTAKAYERDPFYEIDVICDFGECQYQKITSVAIGMVDLPEEGASPDYDANITSQKYSLKSTSAGNPFVVNGVNWYDETTGTDLTATARFIAGHTYTVTVFLVPADGYRFDDSLTGTIDRTTALITGSGSEIQVKYTFPALATNQITSVAIEGITPPALGQAPSYVAIVKGDGYSLKARSDAYYKNGICWSIMESSDLPVSGGTTFEGGQQYQITMCLVAEEGYAFSATDDGTLNVKATVNGKAAEVLGNTGEIVVTYYFTEATEEAKITSAAVTGIDAPVIGSSPDYTSDIHDSRYNLEGSSSAREKNGITWVNNETGNAMTVGSSKFEAGVSYSVVIGVTATEGYAFAADRFGLPQITGTINGKEAEVSGQDEYNVYLTYTFEPLSEEIPEEPPVEIPPIEFQDVLATDYYYEPVQWAVTLGITNGTSETTFSPKVTCSQAHILTFLWRSMGEPTPTADNPYTNAAVKESQYFYGPLLWAWEQGLISDQDLDPNSSCSRSDVVTYLWKLEGSPETSSTPFTDVPSDALYSQAVAWAVEQGVTNGTSETTFSPERTCTRGQIVTFLWRYMNLMNL